MCIHATSKNTWDGGAPAKRCQIETVLTARDTVKLNKNASNVNKNDDFKTNFINQSILNKKLSSFVSTHSINAETGTTIFLFPDAAVLLDIISLPAY